MVGATDLPSAPSLAPQSAHQPSASVDSVGTSDPEESRPQAGVESRSGTGAESWPRSGDPTIDNALEQVAEDAPEDLDALIEQGEQVLQVLRARLDDLGD